MAARRSTPRGHPVDGGPWAEGRAPTRIVLIGMMGSGKTTVGRDLARRWGWSYVDNDEDVRTMLSREPRDVHSEAGEGPLHAAEVAAFLEALRHTQPVVVAAAAAVIEDQACAAALARESCVVYLRARAETLLGRIGSGEGRRRDATDGAWLEARALERDATYARLATLSLEVDRRTPAEVVAMIEERFGPGTMAR